MLKATLTKHGWQLGNLNPQGYPDEQRLATWQLESWRLFHKQTNDWQLGNLNHGGYPDNQRLAIWQLESWRLS
jgi:hypothetical protein